MRLEQCFYCRDITITGRNAATQVAFKNCAPLDKCITRIHGTTIDIAEDLDLVTSMYNLLEYSSNYSGMTGSLWFYCKDEATNLNNDFSNTNNFRSFKYQAKLVETLKLMEQMEY